MKKDVPRFQAERTSAWFQRQHRRLVIRWERLATCCNAFLAIAMIHSWIRRLIAGKVHTTEMHNAQEVLGLVFGAHDQASKVLQPRTETLDLPTPAVAP
jgi:hypothetical protein